MLYPVDDDAEALRFVNKSRYGLSASIWTSDLERAQRMASEMEVGTVFMNRADVLDPELPWVGVKDSGRGCSLSHLGYRSVTRPKSLNFKLP